MRFPPKGTSSKNSVGIYLRGRGVRVSSQFIATAQDRMQQMLHAALLSLIGSIRVSNDTQYLRKIQS
ncbi:hypothetical protein COX84_06820 [Candidatus Micrarchaeota archaeon CG_4_10_14_0_2_um_filter_49_7]|nr:MAG: hypothetical protein COX84_06820 [Candidatus Micrarchaeota archaeon CG_4_10_14_0_2_um_filter_49_7]